MKVTLAAFIIAIILAGFAAPTLQARPQQSSCYASLVSGPPPTLSAQIQSQNSNGAVAVNGVDTGAPTTPFEFVWGDGDSTSGFFPQQHVYANAGTNYVITITATENNGTKQQYSVPLFFMAPSVVTINYPGVAFQIPSSSVTLQSHWSPYEPPTDTTEFPNSSFPLYSRTATTNILRGIASIDYTFANKNSFLQNSVFSIDMFEDTDNDGGESYWWVTPMSVGYAPGTLSAPVSWYVLFNEIGKDTTLNTPTSLTYGGNTDGAASEIYSETMGDIFSYASGCQLVSNPSAYGVGSVAAADIHNDLLVGATELQQAYNSYVSANAPFNSWNPGNGPDPTLGTISTLAWKFIEHAEQQGNGYQAPAQRMTKLLQHFDTSMLASYAPTQNTESGATFRSTLMVTALSYAFSQDLRSEFSSLNFPIDNDTFEQLYEMATGGGASLSLASEAYGSVAVGSTSAGKKITLTNYLLTPLKVSVSFSGSNPKDFPILASSTCSSSGTLDANSSCTYVIAFKPSVRGAENATLSVSETAQDISQGLPSSPQSTRLTGTGVR